MRIQSKIILQWGFISLLLLLPVTGFSDIFVLYSQKTINGIVLSDNSTSLDIQTLTARINVKLPYISQWVRETNLQSYLRLGQEAQNLGKYSEAKEFMQHALALDPQNAALIAKLSDIEYASIEKNGIQPLQDMIKSGKPSDYLNAMQRLEVLLQKSSSENYAPKLKHELANIHVEYAKYLYNYIRKDESIDQLRMARRLDENNENLHLIMAKIQTSEGNELLAQLEREQAKETEQQEKEKEEILREMLASVQQQGCDDIPSPAYWAEEERLAKLQKEIKSKPAFGLLQVNNSLSVLLQAYNAGPGAVVVYDGAVPYTETINYVRSIASWMRREPDSKEYEAMIQKYAKKYNLDVVMVKALIKVESDYNPFSHSKADARGLMQLTSSTWKDTVNRMGVNWSFSKNAYDAEKNIEVGCHYLAWLQKEFLPKHFDMASSTVISPLSKSVN